MQSYIVPSVFSEEDAILCSKRPHACGPTGLGGELWLGWAPTEGGDTQRFRTAWPGRTPVADGDILPSEALAAPVRQCLHCGGPGACARPRRLPPRSEGADVAPLGRLGEAFPRGVVQSSIAHGGVGRGQPALGQEPRAGCPELSLLDQRSEARRSAKLHSTWCLTRPPGRAGRRSPIFSVGAMRPLVPIKGKTSQVPRKGTGESPST